MMGDVTWEGIAPLGPIGPGLQLRSMPLSAMKTCCRLFTLWETTEIELVRPVLLVLLSGNNGELALRFFFFFFSGCVGSSALLGLPGIESI